MRYLLVVHCFLFNAYYVSCTPVEEGLWENAFIQVPIITKIMVALSGKDLKRLSSVSRKINKGTKKERIKRSAYIFKHLSGEAERQGSVRHVEFSADGKFLAVRTHPYHVHVYNIDKGGVTLKKTFLPHGYEVSSAAFGPPTLGENVLVSGMWNGHIIMDSVEDESSFGSYKLHDGYVRDIAFSPNGKYMATVSPDKLAKLVSLEGFTKGQGLPMMGIRHEGGGYQARFSPGSQVFAIIQVNDIELCNIETGLRDTITYDGEYDGYTRLSSAAFSGDGKFFAVARQNRDVQLKNFETSKRFVFKNTHRSRGENDNDLAFSPDSKVVAMGSDDSYENPGSGDMHVKIFSLEYDDPTCKQAWIQDIKHKPRCDDSVDFCKPITHIKFSPDGRLLAMGDGHGGVSLHQKEQNGKGYSCVRENITRQRGGINALAFSPDSSVLAIGSNDELEVYTTSSLLAYRPDQLINHCSTIKPDINRAHPQIGEKRGYQVISTDNER